MILSAQKPSLARTLVFIQGELPFSDHFGFHQGSRSIICFFPRSAKSRHGGSHLSNSVTFFSSALPPISRLDECQSVSSPEAKQLRLDARPLLDSCCSASNRLGSRDTSQQFNHHGTLDPPLQSRPLSISRLFFLLLSTLSLLPLSNRSSLRRIRCRRPEREKPEYQLMDDHPNLSLVKGAFVRGLPALRTRTHRTNLFCKCQYYAIILLAGWPDGSSCTRGLMEYLVHASLLRSAGTGFSGLASKRAGRSYKDDVSGEAFHVCII
ncbi:hypothetical protein HDV57DRAFT_62893 [Trichoderma longibrachiatum]